MQRASVATSLALTQASAQALQVETQVRQASTHSAKGLASADAVRDERENIRSIHCMLNSFAVVRP